MANAKFDRTARAVRRLKAIPFHVKLETQRAIDKGGEEIAKAMRHNAPEDDGDLKDSTKYIKRDFSQQQERIGGVIVSGDDKAFYAPMVEFGTPLQVAQPYFFPTWRAYRKRFKSRRSRAVNAGIKKAALTA